MDAQLEQAANEIKRLKACINNLISVQALHAIWSGAEPSQIARALLDVLLDMLNLDFAYATLKDSDGGPPLDMLRLAQNGNPADQPATAGSALSFWLNDFLLTSPLRVRNPFGKGDVSILVLRLGLQAEMGAFVAGSERSDFPTQTERLLLNVAANQAAIGLQEARLLGKQKQAAVLEERNRMARDIHDTLAQSLTGVIVQLQAAEDASSEGYETESRDHVRTARELAQQGLSEARRSVRALRPRALEEATFWEALQRVIKNSAIGTPLETDFKVNGAMRELPALVQENLLYIGQEALTNTLKYAHATRFETRLSFKPSEIHLELQDNGNGFSMSSRHGGFGLTGMRERAQKIGGSLRIASTRAKGTKIAVILPCEQTVRL
jgi:signal transduction histidine kinase